MYSNTFYTTYTQNTCEAALESENMIHVPCSHANRAIDTSGPVSIEHDLRGTLAEEPEAAKPHQPLNGANPPLLEC